ncbi:hypothetical protein ACIRG4_24430 [Streptomyces sp. NPDC102395]|uniref:hypothetical protein n=1 Tax=Streptomyces sp. NPDC102395 TaxID=3366168 RepID=UPI003825B354
MINAEGSGVGGTSRTDTAAQVWGRRLGYLVLELIALTPPLAAGAFFLIVLSVLPCSAPGGEPIANAEISTALFDPLIPIAALVIGAFAIVAVWGAYRGKPLVWKTQVVLILVTVSLAALCHDPHPTCTVEDRR